MWFWGAQATHNAEVYTAYIRMLRVKVPEFARRLEERLCKGRAATDASTGASAWEGRALHGVVSQVTASPLATRAAAVAPALRGR